MFINYLNCIYFYLRCENVMRIGVWKYFFNHKNWWTFQILYLFLKEKKRRGLVNVYNIKNMHLSMLPPFFSSKKCTCFFKLEWQESFFLLIGLQVLQELFPKCLFLLYFYFSSKNHEYCMLHKKLKGGKIRLFNRAVLFSFVKHAMTSAA